MLAANLSEKAGGANGDDTVSRLVQEVVTLKLVSNCIVHLTNWLGLILHY